MSEETTIGAAAAASSASGTTAAAAPAAPAAASTGTSGNVSSGTASEAMIKAAMASEGATGDVKKPPVPGAASAAAATGTTGQPGTDGKPVDANEPPKERWDTILANQRKLAAEEALKPYAWAKDMKAEEVSAAISLVTALKRDKVAFWHELGDMIGTAKSETKDEAFPAADLISGDGVKAHSDENLHKILGIFKKQLMTQFQGELRPLVEFRDGELSTRQMAEHANNAKSLAGRALASARALPHFKENEAAVVEKLQAMDPALRKEVGPIAAMYMAFESVKAEKVYPTLQSEAEKRVRADYDKKAAASGIHPVGGDGKVKETPVIKGQTGLAAHMERLAQSNDPRFNAA